MSEFHSFKPRKLFSGKNMDIYRESTYPVEVVDSGAPTYYVAYLTENNDVEALCAGDTKEDLLKELYEWKANPLVFKLIKDDIKQYEGDDVNA